MDNQKLEEQVEKSLWGSFRRMASCLTERTAGAPPSLARRPATRSSSVEDDKLATEIWQERQRAKNPPGQASKSSNPATRASR